jgi:transposase
MSTVTIAVDLAKNVFEIPVAGRAGTIKERERISRPRFEQFLGTRDPCRVVMEACATSHFWARYLIARGFEATLLPPHYVKPYGTLLKHPCVGVSTSRYCTRLAAALNARPRTRHG